jgi:tRNA(Ile)-lysidine synthase TilS/MesJ
MAAGNRHLGYKEALNAIEERSPGTKHDFYFGFLDRAAARFREGLSADAADLAACQRCGAPTPGDVCAFCRLVERAAGHGDAGHDEGAGPSAVPVPVPVAFGRRSPA